MKTRLALAAFSTILCFGSQAAAQSWSPAQSEVWQFVADSWDAHAAAQTWSEVLDPAGYGWNGSYPVPIDRTRMAQRIRAVGPENTHLYHRVDPVAITVNGDTAMAYYFAAVVEKDAQGARVNLTERCADTLIKRGGNWRYLGWHCQISSDDD
ncbi:MAG TPA: nuclear transport factor 2 family protein [Sphingomicrobium sp.]|nr:nuclear transport factor 2 family protein [Sphingomicrobium sp.]